MAKKADEESAALKKTSEADAAPKKKAKKKAAKKKSAKKTTAKSKSAPSKGGKHLLIVESPAKAKTIKKFLGRDFSVKASMGHVRDIPSKGRGKKAFGIDFDNNYEPTYEPIKGREKVLEALSAAAEKAEAVYLAPDPDREGEAIAWHIKEALHLPDKKVKRVTFNSITKRAVQDAVENPTSINMNLVNAQQGRRILDRLVGYSLSPFLWRKVTKGLSAGRVQSVAVRMVVEREKEIRAFTPEEYWRIVADLGVKGSKKPADQFEAQLTQWQGQKFSNSALLDEKSIKKWDVVLEAVRSLIEGLDVAHLQKELGSDYWREAEPSLKGEKPDPAVLARILFGINEVLKHEAITPRLVERLDAVPSRAQVLLDKAEGEGVLDPSERITLNRRLLEASIGPAINVCDRRILHEQEAKEILGALEAAAYTVKDVSEREVKSRPSPAFITSTLQQAASTWLGFGTSKTMRVAQQLYEGLEIDGAATGLITYMRTDSTRIAPEALKEARGYIQEHFASDYLPEKAQVYSSKKGAQDAHEAIRPTSVLYTPDMIKKHLTPDQFKLYNLIWRRFVASQMTPAVYLITSATIEAADGILEAKGRRVLFDGFMAIWGAVAKKRTSVRKTPAENKAKKEAKDKEQNDEPEKTNDEEQFLPKLEAGDPLDMHKLIPSQHFTSPPPRYSEASLVRALEKEGIGRPSTYAPIVQTIQDRGYVRQEKRRFHATELGMAVTDILLRNFPRIMNLKFTAGMEEDLDSVEEGQVDWVKLVDDFYKPFDDRLQTAIKEAEPLKGQPAPNGETCPLCQSEMVVRYSQRGAFLGCVKYPDCKGLLPMPGEQEEGVDEDEELVSCPKCGSPMVRKRSKYGNFLACSNYPACKQTLPLGRDGKPVEMPKIEGVSCEKCGSEMIVKMGRRGPFLACSAYPDCKNTKHIDRDGKIIELPEVKGEVCEKCGAEMVVRMSRRGPFLGCSAFPKCRTTRPLPKDAQKGDAKEKAIATDPEEETSSEPREN